MTPERPDLLLIGRKDVEALLEGNEANILERVADAYVAHDAGRSAVPHSLFLRFPERPRDRIIALPAWLGTPFDTAGVKWIASFPGNLAQGEERASAVVILNTMHTGRPQAVLEGSVISAWRTAASAALAARCLRTDPRCASLGFIGCGLINATVARFLRAVVEGVGGVVVYDLDPARAAHFVQVCEKLLPGAGVRCAGSAAEVLRETSLVSIATTAAEPHIASFDGVDPNALVLHLSLRDLEPSLILGARNVVDDEDHVCRARTSLELASERVGHRRFIDATLGGILRGAPSPPEDGVRPIVFSPFGLGALDIAVSQWVLERARATRRGVACPGFFEGSWAQIPTPGLSNPT